MTKHAAVVQGEAVLRERVDAFLQTVTTTPQRGAGSAGMRLRRVGATSHDGAADARQPHTAPPAAHSPQAERQRRRWATQVVVADELARRACEERGLEQPPEVSPTHVLAIVGTDVADLGSIVAATLAHSAAARLLLAELERQQDVPEAAVRDYYERNRDRYLTPDALRRGVDPFGRTAPADFLPYQQAREGIAHELGRAAGHRAFFDWFDQARADVVYAAGHEHPGDPSHPDHEHRH
ncbi:peptidyl-prolyl cis-trans isomerase [Streptomyces sp. NBC_00183]|uniref:peptidyl-prolyl cis-trans isomerase n=1 Tax=unclassified Streptomyces TaxID=2593676 RepID=UPI002259B514|nr:peptidyl-prolyl cis-trans isomerase [Streptomyces sp. NBC_00183]MCX5292282.1 peptidyl-prolyl cis-trans isomerase [Streptomyces sp. NBC_00183]